MAAAANSIGGNRNQSSTTTQYRGCPLEKCPYCFRVGRGRVGFLPVLISLDEVIWLCENYSRCAFPHFYGEAGVRGVTMPRRFVDPALINYIRLDGVEQRQFSNRRQVLVDDHRSGSNNDTNGGGGGGGGPPGTGAIVAPPSQLQLFDDEIHSASSPSGMSHSTTTSSASNQFVTVDTSNAHQHVQHLPSAADMFSGNQVLERLPSSAVVPSMFPGYQPTYANLLPSTGVVVTQQFNRESMFDESPALILPFDADEEFGADDLPPSADLIVPNIIDGGGGAVSTPPPNAMALPMAGLLASPIADGTPFRFDEQPPMIPIIPTTTMTTAGDQSQLSKRPTTVAKVNRGNNSGFQAYQSIAYKRTATVAQQQQPMTNGNGAQPMDPQPMSTAVRSITNAIPTMGSRKRQLQQAAQPSSITEKQQAFPGYTSQSINRNDNGENSATSQSQASTVSPSISKLSEKSELMAKVMQKMMKMKKQKMMDF